MGCGSKASYRERVNLVSTSVEARGGKIRGAARLSAVLSTMIRTVGIEKHQEFYFTPWLYQLSLRYLRDPIA